jgi:hypothetical protein
VDAGSLICRSDVDVEGIPGWVLLSILAAYGLAGVSLLLAVVAGGLLFGGQPQQARKLFAAAFLGMAVAAALMATAVWSGDDFRGWRALILLLILGLLLAGTGQFVAAFRNPRIYAAALGTAASSLTFAAAPLAFVGIDSAIRLGLCAVSCLLLAVASLMIALSSRPSYDRQGRAERPAARSWKGMILTLGLINLAVFNAAVVYLVPSDRILFEDDLPGLLANTHWEWVFAVLAASALISTIFFVSWSSKRAAPSASNPGPL